MSRYFDVNSNLVQAVLSPASDSLTAVTMAGWVLVTAYGGGGFPLILKDPASYLTFLSVDTDGTITAGAGSAMTTGPISAWSINAGGLGYAPGDTGHTTGAGTVDAPYQIFTVGALGVVTDGGAGPTSPFGDGFSVGDVVSTVKTSGLGTGLKYHVDAIDALSAASASIETIPLGVWTHIAATWNSAGDGKVRLYINGVECTYTLHTASVDIDASTGGWMLGKDPYGNAGTEQQKQTAVFNHALSAAQVAALAALSNSVAGIADKNLVAYWPLTSANPEPDFSGYGVEGEIITQIPPETVAAVTPIRQGSMAVPVAPAAIRTVTPVPGSVAAVSTR
jgi:hypothetical protein